MEAVTDEMEILDTVVNDVKAAKMVVIWIGRRKRVLGPRKPCRQDGSGSGCGKPRSMSLGRSIEVERIFLL